MTVDTTSLRDDLAKAPKIPVPQGGNGFGLTGPTVTPWSTRDAVQSQVFNALDDLQSQIGTGPFPPPPPPTVDGGSIVITSGIFADAATAIADANLYTIILFGTYIVPDGSTLSVPDAKKVVLKGSLTKQGDGATQQGLFTLADGASLDFWSSPDSTISLPDGKTSFAVRNTWDTVLRMHGSDTPVTFAGVDSSVSFGVVNTGFEDLQRTDAEGFQFIFSTTGGLLADGNSPDTYWAGFMRNCVVTGAALALFNDEFISNDTERSLVAASKFAMADDALLELSCRTSKVTVLINRTLESQAANPLLALQRGIHDQLTATLATSGTGGWAATDATLLFVAKLVVTRSCAFALTSTDNANVSILFQAQSDYDSTFQFTNTGTGTSGDNSDPLRFTGVLPNNVQELIGTRITGNLDVIQFSDTRMTRVWVDGIIDTLDLQMTGYRMDGCLFIAADAPASPQAIVTEGAQLDGGLFDAEGGNTFIINVAGPVGGGIPPTAMPLILRNYQFGTGCIFRPANGIELVVSNIVTKGLFDLSLYLTGILVLQDILAIGANINFAGAAVTASGKIGNIRAISGGSVNNFGNVAALDQNDNN